MKNACEFIASGNYADNFKTWKEYSEKNPASLTLTGICYETGTDVLPDVPQALECWQKAAENGYSYAMLLLGDYYYHQQDYKQAVEWYQKAEEKRDPCASARLAFCLREGRGLLPDAVQEKEHMQKAVSSYYTLNKIGVCPECHAFRPAYPVYDAFEGQYCGQILCTCPKCGKEYADFYCRELALSPSYLEKEKGCIADETGKTIKGTALSQIFFIIIFIAPVVFAVKHIAFIKYIAKTILLKPRKTRTFYLVFFPMIIIEGLFAVLNFFNAVVGEFISPTELIHKRHHLQEEYKKSKARCADNDYIRRLDRAGYLLPEEYQDKIFEK